MESHAAARREGRIRVKFLFTRNVKMAIFVLARMKLFSNTSLPIQRSDIMTAIRIFPTVLTPTLCYCALLAGQCSLAFEQPQNMDFFTYKAVGYFPHAPVPRVAPHADMSMPVKRKYNCTSKCMGFRRENRLGTSEA